MTLKVHFAGYDNDERAVSCLRAAGVNYRLFTCYPFIRSKKSSDNMRVGGGLTESRAGFRHLIMDSGLFTMMFGADSSSTKSPEDVREWMHRIVAFAMQNNIDASFVECDCQKLISPEFAWQMRREMRQLMPDKEIINVLHMEDGESGFRKIIDFSDYIAISVPELRMYQPKGYKKTVCALTRMARKQKPSIKIHLLGCTEQYLLERNRFCTTADSSSWTAPARFGTLNGRHISGLTDEAVDRGASEVIGYADESGIKLPLSVREKGSKMRHCTAVNYWSAVDCKNNYRKWVGDQE